MTQIQRRYHLELSSVLRRIIEAEESEQIAPTFESLSTQCRDAMALNGATFSEPHWSRREVARDTLLELAASAVRLAKHMGGKT